MEVFLRVLNGVGCNNKCQINWEDIEDYLRQYIGELYQIVERGNLVYIGKKLPDVYTTERIWGENAKANAVF